MALSRVFVANRGEIAVRIVRACRSLGLESVVGVSDADRESLAAESADRAVVLGPAPARDSYLNANLLVHAAKATACDALHPGYGFLSESAALVSLCEREGIAFVGPRADTIERLGDKLMARAIAAEAGVPVVPGSGAIRSAAEARKFAARIGYPVLMKASAGGGGRGMFVARTDKDIDDGFERASAEAEAAFGDGALFAERFVEDARHVEVQIMGDGAGTVVHFGERDCSVQRRFQKMVEEAPAASLPAEARAHIHAAACRLARHLDYRSAGTVEFLYDTARGEAYFIEANVRIQVEHPVTEEITGIDLIAEQLRIAGGGGLSVAQEDIAPSGHAIECRINAEAPERAFAPSPGLIDAWCVPEGQGIRIDSHCRAGALVPPFYDSMIAKLIVRAGSRAEAVARMGGALADFRIGGIDTNLAFQARLVRHPDFAANRLNTRWLEDVFMPSLVH
ncbi:MAG: acetyl-CoA carboxylase biotin carboxylase subunit [Rhodospirillales bacterium]|nr:acetyl-CoA carboxylase biotin carboxylase subunit [Rhodospirillales bacterium]MDE0379361.1 acetyl-CoA carboxylase biotin carboxylase subunit [Rhodospirillales bacterium]